MNALEGFIDDLNTADFDFIEKNVKPIQDLNKEIISYFDTVRKAIKLYQATGVKPPLDNLKRCVNINHVEEPIYKKDERKSSKENIEPVQTTEKPDSPPKSRPRRNAFKQASQHINELSNLDLTSKIRRPTNLPDTFQNIYVKMEKMEKVSTDSSEKSTADNVQVKTEVEEMPAPTRPAPKKKKKKDSKIQVKQEKTNEETAKSVRDSDVIIKDVTITTVDLVDSDDTDKPKLSEVKERSTRTKSKQKKGKRTRTYSSEDEAKGNSEKKRSRSNEEKNEEEPANNTAYEDAISTLEAPKEVANATFVAKSPVNKNLEVANMNATVVVENPKYVKGAVPESVDYLMTDDESEEEVKVKKKNPVKPVRAIPKPVKQVFSPFEQSPVKKKVQAFEKLQEEANALPVIRVTRTKTRARAKDQEEADATDAADTEPKSIVKEKAKIFTPMSNRFLPKAASTSTKSHRGAAPSSSNESLLSAKSASALKASQAEFREREKRRREKEQDALKKREALMQAQIEEKKRKREEKQLKAQQQREALEKEKMKTLEAQKLKDERHRQLVAEQEERKQRQKEEAEKKRLMAKMRAIDEKRKEEEKRIEEQKKAEEMTAKLAKQDEAIAKMLQKQKLRQVPVYLRTRAPLLPTHDCYDSDDEDYGKGDKFVPEWSREENLLVMMRSAFAAGEAIKNTFFSIQAQTPDLQEIFEVIEPQKLKRSSSAVWHKAPRFTMIPGLENHDETEEFDE